jgi:hypothetical protein
MPRSSPSPVHCRVATGESFHRERRDLEVIACHRESFAAMGETLRPWKRGFNPFRLHHADRTCSASRYIPSRLAAFLPCSFPLWVCPRGEGRCPRRPIRSQPSAPVERSHVRRSGAPHHIFQHQANGTAGQFAHMLPKCVLSGQSRGRLPLC